MSKNRAQAAKERREEKFLDYYPHLRRLLVECVVCHHKGLRPDAPLPNDKRPIFRYLHSHFAQIALDENGLCEQCGSATKD